MRKTSITCWSTNQKQVDFISCPKSIKLDTLVAPLSLPMDTPRKRSRSLWICICNPMSKIYRPTYSILQIFEETRCPWSVAPRHPPGLHGCNFALHQHTTPRWYPSFRRSLGNTDQQRPTNRNPDQTTYFCFEV